MIEASNPQQDARAYQEVVRGTTPQPRKPIFPRMQAVLDRNGLTELPRYDLTNPVVQELERARQQDMVDEARAGDRQAREDRFVELCPPAFQETDRARLRADLVDKVLSWQMGPTGLVLYGDTGGGKTRTLWLLLRRLVVDEAIHVRVLSAFDFSAEASDAYRNGTEKAFVSTLAGSVGVLVIDDLGKAKITARVAEALFEIVDRRTAAGRPLIVTTNDVGERLKERFEDQNAAEPLLRRLREFCAAINFRR